MDAPKFLFSFLLLSSLILSSSGVLITPISNSARLSWARKLVTTQHDSLNFPTTTPAIVTVPSATPVTVTPTPATFPPPATTTTPAAPLTNPVTTPTTNNPPVVTNPSTTPAVAPPATTTSPAAAGQSWCIAKSGAAEKSIQAALDYACGIGGADCSTIQQGASCYNPNTLQNHASYAFNSYYQRNPVPTSCDFGGAAVLTTANPSSGSCVFATSVTAATPVTIAPPTTASPVTTNPTQTPPTMASPVTTNPTQTPPTMASPVTTNPTQTPPTMASPVTTNPTQTPIPTPTAASSTGVSPIPMGFGTPPTTLNGSGNPDLGFGLGGATTGGFGDGSPSPLANMNSSVSASSCLQPLLGCILVVASIVVLDM